MVGVEVVVKVMVEVEVVAVKVMVEVVVVEVKVEVVTSSFNLDICFLYVPEFVIPP